MSRTMTLALTKIVSGIKEADTGKTVTLVDVNGPTIVTAVEAPANSGQYTASFSEVSTWANWYVDGAPLGGYNNNSPFWIGPYTEISASVINAALITGSLLGTASFAAKATTASYVASVVSASFATTANHALLSNLSYATANHTGFAGTAVSNVFTTTQNLVSGSWLFMNSTDNTNQYKMKVAGSDLRFAYTVGGEADVLSVSTASAYFTGSVIALGEMTASSGARLGRDSLSQINVPSASGEDLTIKNDNSTGKIVLQTNFSGEVDIEAQAVNISQPTLGFTTTNIYGNTYVHGPGYTASVSALVVTGSLIVFGDNNSIRKDLNLTGSLNIVDNIQASSSLKLYSGMSEILNGADITIKAHDYDNPGSGGNILLESGFSIFNTGYITLRIPPNGTGGAIVLSGSVEIVSGTFNIGVPTIVPTSISSSGGQGAIAYDNDYLYIATGSSAWKRVQLSNF